MPKALEGLRVLDLAILFSAPQVAAMLADLGADVVKIEPPDRGGKRGGDPLRYVGETRRGLPLMWAMVSRNKRAVTVDPDTPKGRELLHRMIERAEVVIENLPKPTLEKWQCTPAQMMKLNPRAVVVTVSCFGSTGPRGGMDGNGSLAEAFGGFTYMTGERDGPPMLPSVAMGDTLTAISGLAGTLAACYWRDARGGTGQHVDVSMFEPVLQIIGGLIVSSEPGKPPPVRNGSRLTGGVPRNTYRTKDDRWVVVSGVTDNQVGRLLPLLGLDDEAGRARFARSPERLQHADELDGRLADWIRARDRDEVLEGLTRVRMPVVPINSVPDILADPHVAAREDLVRIVDSRYGELTMVMTPPKFSATPAEIRWAGPELGAHNESAYGDWLGLGAADLAALRAEKAI